jgi:hypothetical protein
MNMKFTRYVTIPFCFFVAQVVHAIDLQGDPEAFDRFGWSVASGDFNSDGFLDIATGSPFEDVGSVADAGAVNIVYGGAGGLSATSNQLITQNNLSVAASESGDNFGMSVAAGDFNNDGYDDLAVGVSSEDIGSVTNCGAVIILQGGISGLTNIGAVVWHQDVAGVADVAEISDLFGTAVAAGDFDGDGIDDLAIGSFSEDINSISSAGAVNVLYGTNSGLSATGDQFFHQDSAGIVGEAEAGDRFGWRLVTGDFNSDGRDDLAIASVSEDVGNNINAGAVNVIYGSGNGLTATGNQLWHQDTGNVEGVAEGGDGFGNSLAAGDFDNDGYDDLAIGVDGEAIGTIERAGSVNVLYGSLTGLTDSGDQLWHQDSSGIPNAPQVGDFFGNSVAAADFDGDGYDDLAIGVYGENLSGVADAGAVHIIYGSISGLLTTGTQLWHQNILSGATEDDDWFGSTLAAGDFDNDGRDDLVVAAQYEDIGSIQDAGILHAIYGTNSGLNAIGNQTFDQ